MNGQKEEAVSFFFFFFFFKSYYDDWQTTQGKKQLTNLNDRYELLGRHCWNKEFARFYKIKGD